MAAALPRAGALVRLAIAAVFEHTSALQVRGVTDVRNAPSVRLLQRLGFRLLSTQDSLFRGQPCREHVFVLPRPG